MSCAITLALKTPGGRIARIGIFTGFVCNLYVACAATKRDASFRACRLRSGARIAPDVGGFHDAMGMDVALSAIR